MRELFEVIVQDAPRLGFKLRPWRKSLGLERFLPVKNKVSGVLGVQLDKSSDKRGLAVTHWPLEDLGPAYAELPLDTLPGTLAEELHYDGAIHLLSTPSDVRRMLEIFAPV